MSTKNKNTNKATTTGLVAALAASSCCIPPVIAAIAGIGGISSGLAWMEPFRPYLIGLAVIAIGYAWYAHLKPKSEDDCECKIDDKPKWYQTKSFLVAITVFAAAAVSFPYYSGIFFPDNSQAQTIVVNEKNVAQANLKIDGMTCTGCENHVNHVLTQQNGVIEASSSYKNGTATVKFDKTKVVVDQLAQAVEKETGYKVTDKQLNQ